MRLRVVPRSGARQAYFYRSVVSHKKNQSYALAYYIKVKVKLKESHYRPGVAQMVPGS
jgi:hypothetical protein